jgi:hypothetical protein
VDTAVVTFADVEEGCTDPASPLAEGAAVAGCCTRVR